MTRPSYRDPAETELPTIGLTIELSLHKLNIELHPTTRSSTSEQNRTRANTETHAHTQDTRTSRNAQQSE